MQLLYPAFTPTPGYAASQTTDSQIDVTFLDSLQLAGGQVGLAPGSNQFLIQANWHVLAAMDKNYSVAATLLAPDGSALAQRHTYPGLGLRPTRYLQPGSTFTDVYPLILDKPVSAPMVGPGHYQPV
jgi:hypothetical protein